jgi:hypothetical protein
MIDLGDELAGFGEELPRPAAAPVPAAAGYHDRGPNGMRTFGKLADLQKQGFNTEPPYAGFDAGDFSDDKPMTFTFKAWLPDYDDDSAVILMHPPGPNPFLPVIPSITVQLGNPADSVTDSLRRDEEIATIAVPDQPFKWKPHVVASRTFGAKCRHGSMIATCRRCS